MSDSSHSPAGDVRLTSSYRVGRRPSANPFIPARVAHINASSNRKECNEALGESASPDLPAEGSSRSKMLGYVPQRKDLPHSSRGIEESGATSRPTLDTVTCSTNRTNQCEKLVDSSKTPGGGLKNSTIRKESPPARLPCSFRTSSFTRPTSQGLKSFNGDNRFTTLSSGCRVTENKKVPDDRGTVSRSILIPLPGSLEAPKTAQSDHLAPNYDTLPAANGNSGKDVTTALFASMLSPGKGAAQGPSIISSSSATASRVCVDAAGHESEKVPIRSYVPRSSNRVAAISSASSDVPGRLSGNRVDCRHLGLRAEAEPNVLGSSPHKCTLTNRNGDWPEGPKMNMGLRQSSSRSAISQTPPRTDWRETLPYTARRIISRSCSSVARMQQSTHGDHVVRDRIVIQSAIPHRRFSCSAVQRDGKPSIYSSVSRAPSSAARANHTIEQLLLSLRTDPPHRYQLLEDDMVFTSPPAADATTWAMIAMLSKTQSEAECLKVAARARRASRTV